MYAVALLIERQLEDIDADQVVALHEGLDESANFHVILPVESSTAILTSSLSSLGGGEILPVANGEQLTELSREIRQMGQQELDASVELLRQRGVLAEGILTEREPIEALVTLVEQVDAREAIILTEPHIVSEFFHVDWTSRARRKLDVPVLHLLEHLPIEAQR